MRTPKAAYLAASTFGRREDGSISRLGKNIVYNFVGQGLLLLVGLIAVRFVFRKLGADAVGVLYGSVTIGAVLSAVLELGISATTVREISAHADSEPEYVSGLLRTATLLYWLSYLFLAILVYFAAPMLVHGWINLRTLNSTTATAALRVLGIGSVLALPRSLYVSVLRGLQRMEYNNLIDVAAIGLQQAGTVVILARGGDLSEVAWWYTGCYGLAVIAYVAAVRRFLPWEALIPGVSPAVFLRNWRFASRMFSIMALSTVHVQSDKVFASKLLPIGTFGYYAFASSVVAKGTVLATAIGQAAFPAFASILQKHDQKALLIRYQKLQDLYCFGAVPIFAAISFASLPLFSYLFSPQVARSLVLPTGFLCVGYYMNGAIAIPYVLSLAIGKPEIFVRSNLLAIFFVLPAVGIFVYVFGIAGAAFSWIFYHAFTYLFTVRRICNECLLIPTVTWYKRLLWVTILTALTYGSCWLATLVLGLHGWQASASGYLGGSTLFVAAAALTRGPEFLNGPGRGRATGRALAPDSNVANS